MYMYVLLVVCHYYLAMEREKMTFPFFSVSVSSDMVGDKKWKRFVLVPGYFDT